MTLWKTVSKCDGAGTDLVPAWVPIPFVHDKLCVYANSDGEETFHELQMWQTPAILEVVHAAVGLVGSKPSTVAFQVGDGCPFPVIPVFVEY